MDWQVNLTPVSGSRGLSRRVKVRKKRYHLWLIVSIKSVCQISQSLTNLPFLHLGSFFRCNYCQRASHYLTASSKDVGICCCMDRSPNKLNIKAFRKLIMRYLIDTLIIAGECFSQFEANMVLNIDRRWGAGEGGLNFLCNEETLLMFSKFYT